MGDKKGVLEKSQEKAIAKYLDEKIKFKNGLLESFDGIIFNGIVSIIDDYAVDQLNVVYKDAIDTIVEGIEAEDPLLIGEGAATILDTVIDIPNVTDTREAIIFQNTLNYIAGMILMFANEDSEEEVKELMEA